MVFTQVTWQWQGWAGAPGYSIFRGSGNLDNTQTNTLAANLRTFFAAINTYIPTPVSLICMPDCQVVNDGDGSLVEVRSIGSVPTTVTGVSNVNFTGAAGACIIWKTSHSTGRRLLQGRSFMVPLSSAAFSTTGILATAARTALQNAAAALIASPGVGTPGHLVAWHRPLNGAVGASADITAVSVAPAGAVLRSRRD